MCNIQTHEKLNKKIRRRDADLARKQDNLEKLEEEDEKPKETCKEYAANSYETQKTLQNLLAKKS